MKNKKINIALIGYGKWGKKIYRNLKKVSLVNLDVYTKNNITAKRPGDGVSPMKYWDYLETQALENVLIDELVK